jgi:outer membrane protein assembly factor BamB
VKLPDGPAFALAWILGTTPAVMAQPFEPQRFDWPQWQGPRRDNRSDELGLLTSWPKGGPRLVWQVPDAGGGYSAPTVAAGRLFGLSYQGDDEVVWARDAASGKPLWMTRIAPANRAVDYHEGSRGSATIDGDRLYAVGVSGDLACLSVADGKLVWRKHLIDDFGGVLPYYRQSYGYSESPLVDGDRVLVTPGGTQNTVVALDKATGKTVWSASVPEPRLKGQSRAAYASLVSGEVGGLRQYVQFLQGGLVGIADGGKLLWRWDRPSNDIANATTPVFYAESVFASSGYGKGCGLARLTRKGDAVALEDVWFNKAMKNVHGGLVHVNGYVYGNSDPEMLVCLEMRSGKLMWQERGAGRGAIVYADGHLYYRDEEGPILLVAADPTRYVEKGRFDPPSRSKVKAWAHPVIANGRLYLRDQGALQCYEVKAR